MKSKLKNSLRLVLIMIVSIACNGHEALLRADLDLALRMSGENRPELIKVLRHYSQNPKDSLKLESAKFLISNMIHHYSISGEYMDKHIKDVDSVLNNLPSPIKSIHYRIPAQIDAISPQLKTEFDLLNITSDFLIKNIERSFELWEDMPDTFKISFENFCEYILPYRIHNEPLILWKDSSMINYFGFESLKNYEFSMSSYQNFYLSATYDLMRANKLSDALMRKYSQDCIESAYLSVIINRSLGIPSAVDFTPHHATKDDRHYWYANIDSRYLNGNYSRYPNPFAAKVYRKTFSLNPIPEDLNNFVPDFMLDPYNRDVTELYENVVDVEYDFEKIPSNIEYGYLSVFNSLSWNEIVWARLKSGKAIFKKMGREIIYLPTYYDSYNQKYGKYPILIDAKGNVKEIIPNKNITQDVQLRRKFPLSNHGEYTGRRLVGYKLVASNENIYSKFDSISVIRSYKNMEFDTLAVNNDKEYMYWGFTDVLFQYARFAEIHFLNKNGKQIKGIPFSIGTDSTYMENDFTTRFLFDDNALTSSNIRKISGVKFDKPENIAYVEYLPPNDGNGIYPDNDYELLYFDNGEWVSFERKVATGYSLNFKGIPTNALFWLRNHTEGKEERPFTINKNGKIRFW